MNLSSLYPLWHTATLTSANIQQTLSSHQPHPLAHWLSHQQIGWTKLFSIKSFQTIIPQKTKMRYSLAAPGLISLPFWHTTRALNADWWAASLSPMQQQSTQPSGLGTGRGNEVEMNDPLMSPYPLLHPQPQPPPPFVPSFKQTYGVGWLQWTKGPVPKKYRFRVPTTPVPCR